MLVAAGSGVRLGRGTPKALVTVAGLTLLEHAVAGLAAARYPDGSLVVQVLVVAAPPADLDRCRVLVTAAWHRVRRDGPPAGVVAGGADRQASVAAGLDVLDAGVQVVLVHDAARAFAPGSLVADVASAVHSGAVAVVPGLPVSDTVKQVSPGRPDGVRRVERTVDRAGLVTVQTPQGFRADLLRQVHADLAGRTPDAPLGAGDDAGMLEAAGHPVDVVRGHPEAFKVTDPLDLALAAAVLAARALPPAT